MKNLKYIILYCFISKNLHSQSLFLKNKNLIEINTSINSPILSGSFKEKEYGVSGDKIVKKRDFIDYGGTLSYLHFFKNNVGIGFLTSFKIYEISLPESYDSEYKIDAKHYSLDTFLIRFESLKYTNFYFGPKFEFKTKNGYSGIGFAYDLSFGLTYSKVINRNYAYSINNDRNPNTNLNTWTNVDYYPTNLNWTNIFGGYIQTGFKIRKPIGNNLSIFSGFQYTLMYVNKPQTFSQNNIDNQIYNSEDTFFKIQRENLMSIALNLGLTFHF